MQLFLFLFLFYNWKTFFSIVNSFVKKKVYLNTLKYWYYTEFNKVLLYLILSNTLEYTRTNDIDLSKSLLVHCCQLQKFARPLYSIFFSTGNRKSWNVLEVFCILLARFGPTLVEYLLNSSVILFYSLTINIYWYRKSVRVKFTFSSDLFHYLPCAFPVSILGICNNRVWSNVNDV